MNDIDETFERELAIDQDIEPGEAEIADDDEGLDPDADELEGEGSEQLNCYRINDETPLGEEIDGGGELLNPCSGEVD